MIDRRDIFGLAGAIVGHAGLLAAILFFAPKGPSKPFVPSNAPIMVTLADDVGLISAAPDPSDQPPASASAGEEAPPDTEIAPPEPQPDPETQPKPAPPRPNPDASERQRPDRQRTNQQTQPNSNGRPRPGLNLNLSANDGPAPEKTNGTGNQSQASTTGKPQMDLGQAIKRAVQPCADQQVIPAPEARQIWVIVQLRLNRDGSLAGLRIVGHEGTNDSNERYVARVDDAVEAIFRGCTPIRGLPPELYDVPGGWQSRKFRYRLNS
ncbi:hypothetical protein OF829_03210 [Sphingomonas sp. LB-2]|uniref:hypothetical protein n=1 Tax=Sphingomonas caeni TaxID=2984949 RepID=UPI002230FF2B|nr:hypothetical protein [Sphingomonas caeni]MCW3846233.1 hypothetical protein [Sphingomonas caeni]